MKVKAMTQSRFFMRLFACFIALTLTAGNVCKRPPIARTWINPEPGLNELSKLEVHYNCGEKPIKAYDPMSAALWILKAHVQCARTHCTWGRAKGLTHKDGHIEATFSTFSALRNIVIKDDGGLLKVCVFIKYRDRSRQSEQHEYYFHPEH